MIKFNYKGEYMKKKLIVFIFLFILLVLSSCTLKQEIICDDTIELYLGQEKVIDALDKLF